MRLRTVWIVMALIVILSIARLYYLKAQSDKRIQKMREATTASLFVLKVKNQKYFMETTEKTIAQDAYELLKDIPAENWITHHFSDGVGKCCLIGHYTRLKSEKPDDYRVENCADVFGQFRSQTLRFLRNVHGVFADGAEVNNYQHVNGYTQPGIKDRCMALLQDMIKAGY